MFATRWSPLNELWLNQFNRWQNGLNRFLERSADAARPVAEEGLFPPVNLWETEDSVQIEAELPGFRLEDLEIFVTGQNQLSIKGERQPQAPEKAVQHRQERFFGAFTREFTLPVAVDAGRVEARLENGVLRIVLAKQEQAKPRKIVVKG